MSVLRPRNRLVYFRVSEDEFQQFSGICDSAGARSISDLARVALQRMIRDGARGPGNLAARLEALETIMCGLDSKVHQLFVLLTGRPGLDLTSSSRQKELRPENMSSDDES
jgi:hypothetical protein